MFVFAASGVLNALNIVFATGCAARSAQCPEECKEMISKEGTYKKSAQVRGIECQ